MKQVEVAIRFLELSGERYILIDNKIYKVIKTYELSHLLELTLESTNLKVEGKWLV